LKTDVLTHRAGGWPRRGRRRVDMRGALFPSHCATTRGCRCLASFARPGAPTSRSQRGSTYQHRLAVDRSSAHRGRAQCTARPAGGRRSAVRAGDRALAGGGRAPPHRTGTTATSASVRPTRR
jgi:hypothetical protein